MEEKGEERENYLKTFTVVGVVLVIVSVVYPFVVNHYTKNWQVSGTFGDTFGALNTVFSGLAFAGVLVTIRMQRKDLENQRTEMKLQRQEMKDSRKEFLLNRVTNLVYKQIDKVDNSIENVELKVGGNEYKGSLGLNIFGKAQVDFLRSSSFSDKQWKEEVAERALKNLDLYYQNQGELKKLINILYNSTSVVKRVLYNSELSIEEINDLKSIFFTNMGVFELLDLQEIINTRQVELEIMSNDPEDYPEHQDYLIGCSIRLAILLEPILKFFNLKLTKDNLDENRELWKQNVGEL